MPVHDDLGTRMKDYEKRNRYYLQRRIPVIVRCDMRAGHSYTKGFKRPFDEVFIKSMQETAKYLCENIQNAKIAYTQSDEITIVLVDYEKLNTEPFFEYRVDKLCSTIASMATMAFNKAYKHIINMMMTHFHGGEDWDYEILKKTYGLTDEDLNYNSQFWNNRWKIYQERMGTAMFDCRVFNIPKEEVTNNFYWRQLDCSRNSIQMVGQANFSHKELQNKTCNMIQDMLMTQKGINWNDLPAYQKRGSCVVRNKIVLESNGITETAMLRDTTKTENEWIIDKEIPIFKGEGREYIEKLIIVGE